MSKIIAIGHQKYVGKDKFVEFCIDILRGKTKGLKIVRRGFADKLYDICHSLYGWAGFQSRQYYINNPLAKADILVGGETVRNVLIKIGNKLREVDQDIWINNTLLSKDYDILFITDLRFPTEAKAVDGLKVKITRSGLPTPTDEADTALNEYTDWNLHIKNDGDLNGLYKLAETFCERYVL